jgi:AraC-like DNA-binding protein
MAAPQVLERLGADVAKVLAQGRIKPAMFGRPDNVISYDAMGRLFARGVEHTRCEHLGLLVGQPGGLHSLGLVGLLVRCSPDVETALRSLTHHFHLRVRGAALVLDMEGPLVRMGHVVHDRVEATEQINDGALAEVFNVLKELCGPKWRPVEIQLARRVPADVRPFRRFFGAPVRFDADMHAVVFSASWLEQELPAVDPELQRLLSREIQRLEEAQGDHFPTHVRNVLRLAMSTGDVSAQSLAGLLSMHTRTLARRLAHAGTGLRQLLDEVRHEAARQMLADTSLRVGQIAESLGYARTSVFTRAFRRLSGTTPAAWRKGRACRKQSGT